MITPDFKKMLLTSKAFRYLEEKELDVLMNYSKVVTFSDGELLLQQGKKENNVYILISGTALESAKVLGKNTIRITTYNAGDFIGEVGLITKMINPASVIAKGQIKCLQLTIMYFEMLALFYPEIHYKIIKSIMEEVCSRLLDLESQIITLVTHSKMIQACLLEQYVDTKHLQSITYESARIDTEKLYQAEFFKLLTKDEYTLFLEKTELVKAPYNCILIDKNAENPDDFIVLRGAVQSCIMHQDKIAKLFVFGPMMFISNATHFCKTPSKILYLTRERAVLLKISTSALNFFREQDIGIRYKLFNAICHAIAISERSADKLIMRLNSEFYNR